MRFLLLLSLLVTGAYAQSREVILNPEPFNIRLTNGFLMRGCKVVSWSADTATITYVGGTVPVKLVNIAPEDRPKVEKAMSNAADVAWFQAQHSQVAPQEERRPDPADVEAAERKADEIKRAVFYHELMAGMTEEQVIQCMGATPTQKYGGSLWQYERRGKGFKDPAYPDLGIKDRWLQFRNGILVSWHDS